MQNIWLIGGATFVGVLLVASIVVALVQKEETFSEGTPERAVQLFLEAAKDESFQAAYDMLSDDLKESCAFDEYVEQLVGLDARLRDTRLTVKETKDLGEDKVIVVVRVTRISSDGPFRTSEDDRTQRYTLGLEQGKWRFTQYPWPANSCSRPSIEPVRPPPRPNPARPATTTPGAFEDPLPPRDSERDRAPSHRQKDMAAAWGSLVPHVAGAGRA